ncbi:hypothetical protein [Macrococcoides caseolyticum]|uniref:Uncharacterized protein n=1 Tax=Macrococcoides caseolyticum TaxID=69966 RepID=A0ACC9MNH5_9STAP|nr:hypothetical protein [Macrococcus caseolyticus]PKE40472.1 hypothetical protein CW675_01815 [Macrococcus caseolyticus]PKE55324.1 hypothetical protein CW682_12330 [Macrococcus caseolyticus]
MSEYTLSNHAFQRFWERVQHGVSKKKATEWVENAIKKGVECEEREGKRRFRFENYMISVSKDDNTIVTIYNVNVFNNKELSNEIHEMIVAKVNRELKKLHKEKRKQLIHFHESNIKYLKVNNPETKAIINEDIKQLNNFLVNIDDNIEAIKKTAKKYHVNEDKLYLME